MRMTKKITSIVLAVLMVVSMMSVMAVSANAVATEISDSMGLYNACLNGGEYVLTADITTEYNWVENDTIINGNGHTITSTTADGYTMFYWDADKDADLTLTNVTLDGNNKAGNAVDVTPYPSNSNNSGCNVNFDTVTVKNFVSQFDQGVGAVYLFGKSNGSFTNCTFENNTVSTNGSNGFSGADIWCGGGGQLVISGGSYNEVYVNGGTANATISNGAVIDSMAAVSTSTVAVNDSTVSKLYVADINNVTVDNDSTVTVCNAFKPTEDEVLDTYGVAQIGSTKYATLEAAFAAAVDGDTITVLADCAGNGIKVTPAGKFATGLTVDFGGHTYTVDGETVGSPGTETLAFQLLKNNKVTFENGTIYSEKAKMLVQNYCDLTLDNMTLTLNNTSYNGAYTLSNNNGNTVINDTTINANPTTGSFAFDVCRYSSYPSVNVTVTGDSEINGNVEIYASKGQAKDGFSLTLESGTMNGNIVVDATAEDLIGDDNTITKADTFTQTAPEGFKWVDNGDGTSSLAEIVYVAQIGETKYETLEAAFAAAQDGDTIKVLADCAGNGIKVTPAGKFATGLTVDFDGHTYTVDGETVGSPGTETLAFQLLKNNKVTFKNGTLYSEKAKMLVQNYCDLTLDNMTLTLNNTGYDGAYTLSNNNGNTVIKDTTINANPTTGSYAFDVCRYSSYPSVNVTVTGASVINGDVEVFASKSDPKNGFSLTLESGTMTGDIILDKTAQNVIAATPEKAEVTKKNTFSQEAPLGYEWKDNGDGTSSIITAVSNPLNPIEKVAADINDGNKFGLTCDYLKGTLLGVQKKEAMTASIEGSDVTSESHQEGQKNIRFVAVLDTTLLKDADDYGFVLAKVSADKTYSDKIENIKYGMESAKTISAKDTYNNVCGNEAYGDPTDTTGHTDYKYITCAVNNIDDTSKIVARFYYKKGDKVYYAKYAGHNYQYTGCISTANATS